VDSAYTTERCNVVAFFQSRLVAQFLYDDVGNEYFIVNDLVVEWRVIPVTEDTFPVFSGLTEVKGVGVIPFAAAPPIVGLL
jgi:hypothetical protein